MASIQTHNQKPNTMNKSHFPEESAIPELRASILQLRRELEQTTNACRAALAVQASSQLRQLLRTKSKLMRQLLEEQSRLLLAIRKESPMQTDDQDLPDTGPAVELSEEDAVLLSR
jgi:small-conductance mechanosensitive channel